MRELGRALATIALAGVVAIAAASLACAQTAGDAGAPSPLSAAQLNKLLAYVYGPMGARAMLYAPYGYLLGWTRDPTLDIAVLEVGTDNHRHSFVQSRANAGDLAIDTLAPNGAYWFSTHADRRLSRAAFGARGAAPEALDAAAPEVRAMFRDALADWARDIDHSPPPPTER